MNKIRWSNVPIPEGHVALLLLGIGLHRWRPLRLFRPSRAGRILGWPLLLAGILLAGWAVAAVREQDIAKPSKIVSAGPYAFTRNPMYLAWNAIYIAVTLLLNTDWLVVLLPAVLLFTHYFAIRPEERQLEGQFGEEYRRYRARVRRYV
jgi:protein-S-isoprenylcysteine O-methyltransferase Ste14